MCHEIQPSEVKNWLEENKDFQIIDVRESYEYNGGHIEGSKLISLGQIQSRLSEIDKDKPTVFVCHSGSRSGMACQFATSNGYEDSYNMVGGMMSWD